MSQERVVKPCINGCGAQTYWVYQDGKNRPFNAANNELHKCPNYTPKQRRQDIAQEQGYRPQGAQVRLNAGLPVESSSQREEIKAMAQEKNAIAKDTNVATLTLAEATRALAVAQHEIATQMELDRMQREEFQEQFIKEGKKQDYVPENLLEKGKKQDETLQRKT